MAPEIKHTFDNVDWKLSNRVIAAAMGCSATTVANARNRILYGRVKLQRRQQARKAWPSNTEIEWQLLCGPMEGSDGLPTYSNKLMDVINACFDDANKLSATPELRDMVIKAGEALYDERMRRLCHSSDPVIVSLRKKLRRLADGSDNADDYEEEDQLAEPAA